MADIRKMVHGVQGWIEKQFPVWSHERQRRKWERQWANPKYSPFWKTDQPQKELVEAIDSGWFPKNQEVIDVGCGNGEVSRWLAEKGFAVLGIDYSAAAVENCRRLSAGQPNAPSFDVADLCQEGLQLEPAFSLFDRGCFHRIAENFRPIFAQNIARATAAGGHFLLLSGTFEDPRFSSYPSARSEPELREHVALLFGNDFTMQRAETAVINASKDQAALPAVAFWMVRKG